MSDIPDEEALAAWQAITCEERKARAKAWLESRPDWWREAYDEAKRRDPKGTRAAPDNVPVVQTMLSAPRATELMSEEGKAMAERCHSRSVMRRRAAEGDPVAAKMLEELGKRKT